MTYVTFTIAAFVLICGALIVRGILRARALRERSEQMAFQQSLLLDRVQQLNALLKDPARPLADVEADAKGLIAQVRVLDADGSVEPIVAKFQAELARRRGAAT
jgi:hypothetical protein